MTRDPPFLRFPKATHANHFYAHALDTTDKPILAILSIDGISHCNMGI